MTEWETEALLYYVSNFPLNKKNLIANFSEKDSIANMSTVYQSTQINTNDLPGTRKGSKNTKYCLTNIQSTKRKKHEKSLSAVVNQNKFMESLFKNAGQNDNIYLKNDYDQAKDLREENKKIADNKLVSTSSNNLENMYLSILKNLKIWNVYINDAKVDLNFCIDGNRLILANDIIEFRYEKFLKNE
jgi:hypothetical protein